MTESKNFTISQIKAKWHSVGWCCENCGEPCGDEDELYPPHHKKKKSALTAADLSEPGGGLANAAALCPACHTKAHLQPLEMQKFNLYSWEKIV